MAEPEARPTGVAYAPHRRTRSGRLGRFVRRGRERAAVGGFRAASAVLGRITPRVSMPVARSVFTGSYYAWPHKRRIVRANAAKVLGLPPSHPDVARLARRIFATYAQFTVELMRLPSLPADEPSRIMRPTPGPGGGDSFIALCNEARAAGRGVIGVSGHMGSIDILAGAFTARGLPIHGVADDSAYPELFEMLNVQRRRWGVGVIPWRNLREIFRVLRKGEIVGLVVDWGYRPEDLPVRLFGHWTTLPAGPAILAARTGSLIVPVICRRNDDGTYEARHQEPFEVPSTSPADQLVATQRIANALEGMIAAAPEQWYSFKPMWPSTGAEAERLESRARGMAAG